MRFQQQGHVLPRVADGIDISEFPAGSEGEHGTHEGGVRIAVEVGYAVDRGIQNGADERASFSRGVVLDPMPGRCCGCHAVQRFHWLVQSLAACASLQHRPGGIERFVERGCLLEFVIAGESPAAVQANGRKFPQRKRVQIGDRE